MRNSFVYRLALGLLAIPLVVCLVVVFVNESGERHSAVQAVSTTAPAIPTLGLDPSPTEIIRYKEDRDEFKRQREEWLESLHYAAPGTDWKAIEKPVHPPGSDPLEADPGEAREPNVFTMEGVRVVRSDHD